MKWKTTVLAAVFWSSGVGLAWAAPGPQEACQALSERTREAATLKKQGLAVDKAVETLSSQPAPGDLPAAQQTFYKAKLPGATRFAYMARMSADGTAQFYLKQCLQGS